MNYVQAYSSSKVDTYIGLLLLWVATATWLLTSGPFAGYLLLVSPLLGGLLMGLTVLVWLLLLRWGANWIIRTDTTTGKHWLKGIYLGFALTQALAIIWVARLLLS